MLTAVNRGSGLVVKLLAFAAVLAVVAAACARGPGPGSPLTTQGRVAAGSGSHATAAPRGSAPSDGSAPSGGTTNERGTTTTGGSPTKPQVVDAPVDHGQTGSNGYWYLNGVTPALDVEIDAVPGMAPSQGSLALLRDRLGQVTDKPGGIDILPVRTVAGSETTWTDAQVRATENHYRTTHNSSHTASIYLLFVDGQSEHQGAIGVAFDSSSAVVFEQAIRDAATPLITPQDIERADVVHEVGHLLSLVNLTYKSPRNHEDPDPAHAGHSSDPNSVMYWAIDNVGVATLLGGHTAPPTTFDADDLADLSDVKGGKLGPH